MGGGGSVGTVRLPLIPFGLHLDIFLASFAGFDFPRHFPWIT